MPQWQWLDSILVFSLLPLLGISGFFSGSETALFSLTENERLILRRRRTLSAKAVETLLADQRMLLITILLGNMTTNVLYFVISSVLLMRVGTNLGMGLALAVASLLMIILFGEVLPKMAASSRRIQAVRLIAPALLALHRLIGPLRIVLEQVIVSPLSRLTAPPSQPPRLDVDELGALLDISSRQGVIDQDEQRTLHDVFRLNLLKVRDIMTPRTQMQAVSVNVKHHDILEIVGENHLTRLPVYDQSPDHIVGILLVKNFLLDRRGVRTQMADHLRDASFIPALATLVQLLDHFRDSHHPLSIVVDEYGGTAGVVTLKNIVAEITGDMTTGDVSQTTPQKIGPGQWRISGDMSVHDWADTFGERLAWNRVSTVGGLILDHLGQAAMPGDHVELGNVRLDVEAVDRTRITFVKVTLTDDQPSTNGESQ